MEDKRYPRLVCDLPLLRRNVEEITRRCHEAGIRVTGVVKGVNAQMPMVEQFVKGGCDQLASSRLDQIERMRRAGFGLPTVLIRVPMMSELEDVARLCDYSLESDLSVLEALNEVCLRQGVRHKVILMADLGDLREGWWDQEELLAAALRVERELSGLELAGIGTNLGCWGAIVPTVEKMEELAALAGRVEQAIGRELEIVSGGATTSFRLVHLGTMPAKINHLRIGEAILENYDYKHEWGFTDMGYLSSQVFTLQAEVLECRTKPSHPVGEIFMDAFGQRPTYEDKGLRRRALLGIGKLDMGSAPRILPRDEGVVCLGGSSDHSILDVEECPRQIKAGDIMEFDVAYTEVLFLTESANVAIEYLEYAE